MNTSPMAAKQSGVGIGTTPAAKVAQNANMARCGACSRFIPDSVNPPEGVGRCAVTLTGLPPAPVRGYGACYPFSPRTCANFQPLEDNT